MYTSHNKQKYRNLKNIKGHTDRVRVPAPEATPTLSVTEINSSIQIPRSNPDYYDDDNSKVIYLDYNAKYQADIDEGLKSVLKPGEMGEPPILKDYSIELSRRNIFKNPPQVSCVCLVIPVMSVV